MYGTRVNTLTVFIKTHDTKKNLWVHEGGEIDGWLYAYVPLDFTDSFQLVFEGRRGSTTHGDISIDDIRVYDTECRLAPYHSIVCDFEQEHWCDFIQDKNDDFDFKRTNGATASIGTGPSVDHTTNTEYGHYIYVDSSEQNAGDVARMWTPYITWDSASIRKCFHWYLHHQGITGSYTAYREFEYDGKPYTILCCFIVPENNLVFGDNWIRAGFDIYFYEHPNTRMRFQIVVTAADGDNGDMASDDYYVNDGKCPDRVNHDFDDGFGQWFNDRNGLRDEFDWVIGSGEHRYGMTGPDIDHTQRTTQGKYALCDVSGGSKGDRAVLESRTRFVQNKCITFWYHMYGEHVGELRLLLREGDDEILVWRLEGQQNKKDEWKKARVGWKNHISGGAAIAHLIEVIRGDGDYGDIAIDDVLSEGTYCDELLPPEANPNPVKSSNKIGMIVGIVLAALVFITLCAVICYRYRDSISTSTYKLFSRKEETDTTEIVDDQPRI
ncbi:MAM and LDL-receptor class A domain-containing protein 1-like [Saccoglossus kowalevskii]